MIGLIRTPEETTRHLEQVAAERRPLDGGLEIESEQFTLRLAQRIQKSWQAAKNNKTTVEQNMLECLRERKGEYGPAERRLLEDAGGSDIYIKLATAKIRAGIAHIKSILLPAGTRAHGIEPTRNPVLPQWMDEMVLQRIMDNPNMQDTEGRPVDPLSQIDMLRDMAKREMNEMAVSAARAMDESIRDTLQEGDYQKAMADFIDDFCTYPAAFLKGPYFAMQPKLKWEMTAEGMKPVQSIERVMKFRTINPFDAYPAPGVDSIHKGDFIERLRMNKAELYRMRDLPGYNKAAIMMIMEDHGHQRLENWLWTDSARQQIADHNYHWYASTTELDGLHWFGRAQGSELLEWGMEPELIPDPMEEYEVDAILIGRHVARASVNPDPLYRRPAHSTCYEKIPGTVFGNSVSMLMRPTSRMVNATARSLQNNLAHASGFQVEVNHARVSGETDIHDIHPFKVWQTEESEYTGDRPAVRFFQPNSNADELLAIMDRFKEMADNDTGIPEFLHGGGGSNTGADATARGRSMLMDQSAKLLRSSITNIDMDVVVPMLRMIYDHKMLNDPDPNIKGDSQIVARGANAMLQRESARQAHMALLELTNNPVDQQIIGLGGRAHLLKNVIGSFEDIDQDQVMPEGEEMDRRIAEIEAQPQPPDPAVLKVQATQEIEQQKLAMEEQRMTMERELLGERMGAERIIEQMRLTSKEKISRDDLDKTVQDEVVKLRATRMSERERMQMDVRIAKMQAEKEVRLKVHELKSNREMSRSADAAAKQSGLATDEIRNIVEGVVAPMIAQLQGETSKVMDSLTKQMGQENGAGTINVNIDMPDCKPANKRIKTSRDASGNLQATVEATE